MKRSEMIEKITDRLADFNTARLSHEDLATLMLTVVEKAGMKPPENGCDYESHFDGDDYFCVSTPTYEWDSENE